MISFEVEGMSIEPVGQNFVYNPSMAKLQDGVTEFVPNDGTSLSVDNVMVKPALEGGALDLILVHSLAEAEGVVTKAQIIGKWHFNSPAHLQQFSDMLAESVRNPKSIDYSKLEKEWGDIII
jgi:hypothetical protein